MKISPSYKQSFFVSICILRILIETYQAISNTNFTKNYQSYKNKTSKFIGFLY